jgi:hypothetical protein
MRRKASGNRERPRPLRLRGKKATARALALVLLTATAACAIPAQFGDLGPGGRVIGATSRLASGRSPSLARFAGLTR